MLRSVSAFCTWHTSRLLHHQNHLPPFALITAFPCFVAGCYSGDYGMAAPSPGPSRALGRSRGTSSSHVRDRGRCPTHPLAWPHWSMSYPAKVCRPAVHADTRVSGGYQTQLPPGVHIHHWGLGFRQSSFHHIGRVQRDRLHSVLEPSRLTPACYCPVGLSASGKLVTQTRPSSASRLNRGCDDAPHGAHCA
jgi:hypothetical protein